MPVNHFAEAIASLFEETLHTHHGHYLDRGTSLCETLATVTAEEASRPVSASCASIAAQVNHTTYYLEVLGRELRGQEVGKIDWTEAWTIGPVDDTEWAELVERLRSTAEATLVTIRTMPEWQEDPAWAAAAIAVHTAYHLGEIRQALCTIQPFR